VDQVSDVEVIGQVVISVASLVFVAYIITKGRE